MKKLIFSAVAVLAIVGSAMAFRTEDKVFCLNEAASACDVQVNGQSTIDRQLGVIGSRQCAATATLEPCSFITIYKGL